MYAKKPRTDSPRGFTKPAGYEDVKKGGTSRGPGSAGKESFREQKGVKGARGADEREPTWGKQGTERAWDAGKEDEGSEDEDDEEEKAFTKAADAEEQNWEGGEGGSASAKKAKGKKGKRDGGKKKKNKGKQQE